MPQYPNNETLGTLLFKEYYDRNQIQNDWKFCQHERLRSGKQYMEKPDRNGSLRKQRIKRQGHVKIELLNVLGYKPVNWIRGAKEYPTAEPYKRQSYPITGLGRPFGFQEVKTPRISRHSAHVVSGLVKPKLLPPLPPSRRPWCSYLFEAECGWKDQEIILFY